MRNKSFILILIAVLLLPMTFAANGQEVPSLNRNQNKALDKSNSRRRINFRRTNTSESLADAILSQGDIDKNKLLTKDELRELADRWFASLDVSRAGVLNQEEFLRRFGDLIPPSETARPQRRFSGFRPNRYLGLFVAIDVDRDASISHAEFNEKFAEWFDAWDTGIRKALDRETLLVGLRAALPRTNMGTGASQTPHERPRGLPEPPPSPVLAPTEAIKTLKLERGFHVELAASEPMIEDPVAISFDEDGRLYVVEMRSYMLDIDGGNERQPIGRISRLVDTDHDGRFDKSTIFLDQLVLPRSVAASNGGVLYVADHKLYFARDSDADGEADYTQLVDADYGGGNIEHAPNGLVTALDNWIYNARSRYRYRWIGDVLVKQPTALRGQWGIAQDNYGRLFYNVNNSQLLGDFTPPNYISRNTHHPTSAGINLFVATDQRVFPIRMNTAVNRGYLPDVLDSNGRLYVFASSCSPVIYRGDNFPSDFVGNAFVCDSAANLIKRNVVFDNSLTLSSKFAYERSEFLASTDERFRPVGLSNGPDGALWAVDMYRGINQYAMFMTDYLRNESLERGLDKGIHFGRIYRIVSDNKTPASFPYLSQENSLALVERLSHPNGWIRDTAQRLLVERADAFVLPKLVQLVSEGKDILGCIHGLWTLEGICAALPETLPQVVEASGQANGGQVRLMDVDRNFRFTTRDLAEEVLDACYEAMDDEHPQVQIAAIRAAEALALPHPEHEMLFRQQLTQLLRDASPELLFQITLTSGNLGKPEVIPLLVDTASKNAEEFLIREAIVSGLYRWEVPFLKAILGDPRWNAETPGRSTLIRALATAVMRERHPVNVDELLTVAASQMAEQTLWRCRSLLAGMTDKIGSRTAKPIRMKSEPSALKQLSDLQAAAEQQYVEQITSLLAWPGHQFDIESERASGRPLTSDEISVVAEGKLIFRKVCAGCHGLDGEGIRPLAAPLVDSDWVLGSEDRLIRVLLNGLTGAVEVDGITYQPPIVLPEMPAVGMLDDAKISAVLSYVRRAWGHQAEPISKDRVAEIRRASQGRSRPWTAQELSEL